MANVMPKFDSLVWHCSAVLIHIISFKKVKIGGAIFFELKLESTAISILGFLG